MLNNSGTLLLHAMLYLSQTNMSPENQTNITYQTNTDDPMFENATLKCYGIYGCFSIISPWVDVSRPVSNFPDPPDKISPRFCLYTRYNPTECQLLDHANRTSIYRSYLIPLHKTYVITHGFLETGERPWLRDMTRSLLEMEDANVIVIDWGKGSVPPYTQAVANIRLVGRMAALLIHTIRVTAGIRTENCHLIGHSLGSHLSGYIGNTLHEYFGHTVGRITGLDPAEPHFDHTDLVVRLDTTDALFVDIIHSNARPFMTGGLGMEEPIGHFDFYPNGGDRQPGCDQGMKKFITNENQSVFHGLRRFLSCDHVRSHEYLLEAINNTKCKFVSVECESYEKFLAGKCFPCQSKQNKNGVFCASFGLGAYNIWKELGQNRSSVKMYTMTNSERPFCEALYRVTLVISNSPESIAHKGEIGQFSISIIGSGGRTNVTNIMQEQYYEPGSTHQCVIGGTDVGKITSAVLHWVHHTTINILTWRFDSVIYVGSIVVETFVDTHRIQLCPVNGEVLGSQNAMNLVPCNTRL